MHNDPDFWDNPSEFRPERFLLDNGELAPRPESFLPFSAGKRVCLGENLAKMMVMIILPMLFQQLKFTKPESFELSFEDSSLVNILKPYEVCVEARIWLIQLLSTSSRFVSQLTIRFLIYFLKAKTIDVKIWMEDIFLNGSRLSVIPSWYSLGHYSCDWLLVDFSDEYSKYCPQNIVYSSSCDVWPSLNLSQSSLTLEVACCEWEVQLYTFVVVIHDI